MNDLDQSIVGWKRRREIGREMTYPLAAFLERQGDPVEADSAVFFDWASRFEPRTVTINGHVWAYCGKDAGSETT